VNGTFIIDSFERVGRRQDLYFVERLRAVQALPVMYGPKFIIKLETVIIFLKKVRASAKGAHDRVHGKSSEFPPGHSIASEKGKPLQQLGPRALAAVAHGSPSELRFLLRQRKYAVITAGLKFTLSQKSSFAKIFFECAVQNGAVYQRDLRQ
jgi:hypothetical protein